jgi:hypothetical protein
MNRYLALAFALLLPIAASAGDRDDDKPPPTIVCETPAPERICPSVDALLESQDFEEMTCKQRRKSCRRVAGLSYRCERSITRAVFRSARKQCEARECHHLVRGGLRQEIKDLKEQRAADRAKCSASCGE